MHARISDVFGIDWHVPLPDADALVVRGGDNPTVILDEGDCVDGAKMAANWSVSARGESIRNAPVVLLYHFARVGIPAHHLLVLRTSDDEVLKKLHEALVDAITFEKHLLVRVGVEFDTVWDLFVGERRDAYTYGTRQ